MCPQTTTLPAKNHKQFVFFVGYYVGGMNGCLRALELTTSMEHWWLEAVQSKPPGAHAMDWLWTIYYLNKLSPSSKNCKHKWRRGMFSQIKWREALFFTWKLWFIIGPLPRCVFLDGGSGYVFVGGWWRREKKRDTSIFTSATSPASQKFGKYFNQWLLPIIYNFHSDTARVWCMSSAH